MKVEEVPSYTPAKGSKRPQVKNKSLRPIGGLKRKPKAVEGLPRVSSRKKKTPEAKLKAQLWELCKQITRTRYGNSCYTCPAKDLAGANWHTAHFIARSVCGAYLKYDLRNLRPGCYRCNVSLAGNGAVFYRRMVEREGQAYVDGIFADKDRITKTNKAWYQEKIDEYQTLLTDFSGHTNDLMG